MRGQSQVSSLDKKTGVRPRALFSKVVTILHTLLSFLFHSLFVGWLVRIIYTIGVARGLHLSLDTRTLSSINFFVLRLPYYIDV
jgi:hypothetical protein